MFGQKEEKSIFRKDALERLSSPEQLDQLLEVVNRKSLFPLAVLSGLILFSVLWGIFGHIPITVDGQGIFVYPRQVVSFQSGSAGQIIEFDIKVGDFIRQGDIIGRINQPGLIQQLEQEKNRLAELKIRSGKVLLLSEQRIQLEQESLQKKQKILKERIESSQRIAEIEKDKKSEYLNKQKNNLNHLIKVTKNLDTTLKERYESYKTLKKEGLSSDDSVLNARRSYLDNQVKLADLELRQREVELKLLETENTYLQNLDQITDLKSQLQQLSIKASQLEQQQLENTSDIQLKMQEHQRNIERYQKELENKGTIVSEYTGRVLEITAAVGQIINAGQRLGAIEAENANSTLMAVAYFEVQAGKKLKSEMPVRISPTTVERERYGSLLGKLTQVSAFPVTTDAITNVIGNAEVAQNLARGGAKIQAFIELNQNSATVSGYQWTSGSGPNTNITAGTTLTIRTTVEQRKPITYVIPILRHWSGL